MSGIKKEAPENRIKRLFDRPAGYLQSLPLWAKSAISVFLCGLTVNYFFFLFKIWVDTEFKISLITEAYRDMGLFELVYHSYQYSGWFLFTFAALCVLLGVSSYSARLKASYVFLSAGLVFCDLLSVWLIQLSGVFSYMLFICGFSLAALFASAVFLIVKDFFSSEIKI